MISVIATNITSPLGFTTEENYQAVLSGCSALKRYEGLWGLPEPFAASLFTEEQKAALAIEGYTFFEALAIRSIRKALTYTSLGNDISRIVLILSTTKGNIEALGEACYYPSEAAQRIAEAIGLTTKPIVVCNACVSGLSAQLLADRLLSEGIYDYAIVVGAEVQSKFIVSGFQCLKAVSEEPCRPFDIERNGLNPGEAAATIVFARDANKERWSYSQMIGKKEHWCLISGASCNDAYHNVSPSPQGDGLTSAINAVMKGRDKSQLATICAHGTATLYNDQMESVAIQRAGLSDIPLSALKGYYGHTMGAAGVLETILTMIATGDGIILPSKGFTESGVSGNVNIIDEQKKTDKRAFLKIMSGFGGCNVAAMYERTTDNGQALARRSQQSTDNVKLVKAHTIRLSSEDGKTLTDIYKQQIGDYPKFYKMDLLTRLAFVATEKTLSNSPLKGEDKMPALILFNHSSSIVADRQFLDTIKDAEDFFPSPSLFVYTLPNITTGEIAIRHHLQGETSFYILPDKDEALMQQILEASLAGTDTTTAICGWVDAESETCYECELSVYNII
ncbi:MAG: 3-oxoacyl-ACP synthase [Bacteroidaceae bacterium]|nr:3-oxoacyl-ACP synthase [Bacteroidaceae bacterium]